MKRNYLILGTALLLSAGVFAQKDQIKAAEKALKGGNPVEALNQLKQAEGAIGGADASQKAQYYLIKGNAAMDLAGKKMELSKNLLLAAQSYQEVIATEKAAGKSKYTEEANNGLNKAKNDLLNAAQAEGQKENYKVAADMLYASYQIDKNPETLYYTASYYLNGQDYDKALQYFEELKKLNYSGEGMNYYAKNLVSEQEEYYGNNADAKKNRDNQVRLKMATAPRDEKVPSKKADIARYMGLIYMQKGDNEKAKSSIAEARAGNPDDVALMQAEADLLLKMGDTEGYKNAIAKVVQKDPSNPDLFFNLGVTSSKTDPKAAEEYYSKAIALKPDYWQAYLNMALLKLRDEGKLVDEMNKLGTSDKDMKRYDVLKKQRDEAFRSAVPALEKAYELHPDNDVAETLLNVYGALEMTDKRKALKAKMGK